MGVWDMKPHQHSFIEIKPVALAENKELQITGWTFDSTVDDCMVQNTS